MSTAQDMFWLVLREPGSVPQRKGPWPRSRVRAVLREFITARPTAYIDVLTIGSDGPSVQHGPELLQMLDGRSIGVGRRHNARTRAAHAPCHAALAAGEDAPRHGWVFRDPDSGVGYVGYSLEHPVESGQFEAAEDIRPATAQERALYGALQAEYLLRLADNSRSAFVLSIAAACSTNAWAYDEKRAGMSGRA